MSERQLFPHPKRKDHHTAHTQPDVARIRRRPSRRLIYGQRRLWFLLGIVLLSVVTLFALTRREMDVPKPTPETTLIPLPAHTATGTFREFPLPQSDSEVMRPAIDKEGRVWFGAMGQNALVVFDPRTRTFRYLTPPHGHHGIMGVQVAPDDTIWFAEQEANYLGHYFPTTGRYQLYPLPWLTIPDPAHRGQTLSLPSAPNELALDGHGVVWFTEFNADSLGRLDPRSVHLRQYPLSATSRVQTLYPYGVTVDALGMVWFTESGTNQLGRLDPTTGKVQLFVAPDRHALLMEIASDGQGTIWVTSFTPGLLFRLLPGTGTFTSYVTPFTGGKQSALYGLLVTSTDRVWVTMLAENVIARLDVVAGRFTYYRIPIPGTLPLGLAIDANQGLWFTGIDQIGVLHPSSSV